MGGSRTGIWSQSRSCLLAATIAALMLLPAATVDLAAQEATPAADEAAPEGINFEFLAQTVAEELPAAPAVVALFRTTVSPGASDQIEAAPSVELVMLEAGELTLDFAGPATIVRAGETGAEAPQEALVLGAGDAFLVSGGDFTVRNDGAEPAQVVGLGVFSAAQEEAAMAGTPAAEAETEVAGITFQPLSQGVAAALSEGPTTLALLRVTVDAGVSVPPEEPHAGPELIFMESGSLAVTVTAGEAYVLRPGTMATPGAEFETGELATIGEEITLEAGDAFFAHTGSVEDARNPGDEPAVALVAIVTPAGHEEAEHAEGEAATPVS